MSTTQALLELAADVAGGSIQVVDPTQALSEDTPILMLSPEFGQEFGQECGQCTPFSRQEISRYDDRGVAGGWSNFTVGEHTGSGSPLRALALVAGN